MNTQLHDGLLAIRFLKALAAGRGERAVAARFAESQHHWGGQKNFVADVFKSAVAGLDLASVDGGSQVTHDMLAALQPLSIVGRLQNLGRVPPSVPLLTQDVGAVAGWVGQGQNRRLSVGSFTRENLPLLTVAALSVATDELLADGSMDGETELLRNLLAACATALDAAFIDPSNSGITDVLPASVTSGISPIYVQGSAISDLDQSLAAAIAALVAAGSDLSAASWICSPVLAAGLSLARGSSGAPAFPGMFANGGKLLGLPALTSASCAPDSDGFFLTLVDASQVTFAEGTPNLSTSKNAAIEMSDAPTGSTTTPSASTGLVSMFQSDCTALLASLAVNWRLRRSGCVQVIGGVPATLAAV